VGLHELSLCECNMAYHTNCVKDITECVRCQSTSSNIIQEKCITDNQKLLDIKTLKKATVPVTLYGILRVPYRVFSLIIISLFVYINYLFGNTNKRILTGAFRAICYVMNIRVKTVLSNSESSESSELKKITSSSKVYISNHMCYYDAIILSQYVQCGAIGSAYVMETLLGKILKTFTDIITIVRGTSQNSVQLMNNYLDTGKSILVFPQGLFGNYNTLTHFRTGAFATRYNVQPIILKYVQDISCLDPVDMLMFDNINVNVHILEPIEKLENESVPEYAERARNIISEHCELKLSNVDSRDTFD